MTIVRANSRSDPTFFVFRNDGVEVEVVIKEGLIIKESPELTELEREWFLNGNYKKLE